MICRVSATAIPNAGWQDVLARPSAAPRKQDAIDPSPQTDCRAALVALQAAASERGQAHPALGSAIEKLAWAQPGGGEGLVDALGQLLLAQNKQTTQRCQQAKGQIAQKFKKLEQQNQLEMKQICKRIEEAKSSSIWDCFGKICQAIGAALGAVAGLATGNPLIVTGAALAIGGFATSFGNTEALKWLSFGLSMGGAAASVTGCFVNANLSSLSLFKSALGHPALQAGTKMAAGYAAAGTAVAAIGKGYHDMQSSEAEATLMDVRRVSQQLQKTAEDEREVVRALLETETRGVTMLLKTLKNVDRATLATVKGGAR